MAMRWQSVAGLASSFVVCAALVSPLMLSTAAAEEGVSNVADSAQASVSFSSTDDMESESSLTEDLPHSNQRYYIGNAVNAGLDNGFSQSDSIDEKDPHFGWELGRFYVSGYTRQMTADDGTPVFLKNVGDKVGLYFNLEQDIDCLNGNDKLTINDDANGSDLQFGIRQTDFGRGTLIVRHTDYQNNVSDPVIYTDYLPALVTGADTEIDLFEEGDYEVSLDYEVKDSPRVIPGVHIEVFPSYSNYRISFKFSVRNGNCMVFPFDSLTGEELTNKSSTPNGFYLDLARSRYLDIDVRREELDESGNELVEDTRFNRPAADGDEYTEEGLYVITVHNRYTGQQTEKQIYVGTDEVMRAHAATGESISEIREQLADGATVDEDGNITLASNLIAAEAAGSEDSDGSSFALDEGTSSRSDAIASDNASDSGQTSNSAQAGRNVAWAGAVIAAAVIVAIVIAAVAVVRTRGKSKGKEENDESTETREGDPAEEDLREEDRADLLASDSEDDSADREDGVAK